MNQDKYKIYANMPHRIILVEGLDRLGKSSLIENIQQKYGYHQVIHMSKPKLLEFYGPRSDDLTVTPASKQLSLKRYQQDCFINMFNMMRSDAHIIFDRAHLGEFVYAPLYRNYPGEYVFALEQAMGVADIPEVHLVLLTENFNMSTHFVDDGESFDVSKRKEEQDLFITAFNRSRIKSKKIVCVTDPRSGAFKPFDTILEEALL